MLGRKMEVVIAYAAGCIVTVTGSIPSSNQPVCSRKQAITKCECAALTSQYAAECNRSDAESFPNADNAALRRSAVPW